MLIAIEKITTRDKKGNLLIFEAGNEVKGLSKEDEDRLINLKVAFSTESEEELIKKKRIRRQFSRRINKKKTEEYYYG